MTKEKVSDQITDQEMDFARLVLAGTMNDRDAAQSVGLYPGTAAHIKSKPCVQAYMLGHRAAVQQQLVEPETEALRRRNQRREQVLDRLLELANIGPEMTRGSITGQVKAASLIVAVEGLIPDRRARSSSRASTPPPVEPLAAAEEWLAKEKALAKQTERATDPEPSPAPAQKEDDPGLAASAPNGVSSSETAEDAPAASAPDTALPLSIKPWGYR